MDDTREASKAPHARIRVWLNCKECHYRWPRSAEVGRLFTFDEKFRLAQPSDAEAEVDARCGACRAEAAARVALRRADDAAARAVKIRAAQTRAVAKRGRNG